MKNILLLVLILFLHGCGSMSQMLTNILIVKPEVHQSPLFDSKLYTGLAIFVEDNSHTMYNQGSLRMVEDAFMNQTLDKGYLLAARSDVESVKKEISNQNSPFNEKDASRIGHLLNVPAIIVVSVNQVSIESFYNKSQKTTGYKCRAHISARMISTEMGEVVWTSSYNGENVVPSYNQENAIPVLSNVAKIVASGLPPRN